MSSISQPVNISSSIPPMSVPISIAEAETKLPIIIQPNNLHSSPSSPPVSPPAKPSFMSLISKLRPRSHGSSPREEYPPSADSLTSSSYLPYQQPLASPPLSPCSYPSSPTFSPYDPNATSTNPQFQQQYQLLLQQHQVQKSQQNAHGQIFGVPLQLSIMYAKSNITYQDIHGNDHIYGQVPIIVAKCASYLKNNAADVEGIFRLSGSSRRIKELQSIFSTPPSYGKDLDWNGFTVHDAANVLRRYLNNLSEPIIPLDLYEKFHLPLFNSSLIQHLKANQPISVTDESITSTTSNQNNDCNSNLELDPSTPQTEINYVIDQYKILIESIPDLNRQLLLYILDLLAFFASKSQKNLMPAVNLAAIFQPSILSHPNHDMDPNAYHLSRAVVQFLIEHFRSIQPKLNSNSKKPSEIPIPKTRHHSRRHSKSMSSADVPQNISCLLSDEPKQLSKTNYSVPPVSLPSGGFISSLKRASSFGRRRRTFSASNYLPIPKPQPFKSPALVSPSFSIVSKSSPLSSPTFAHEPFGFPSTVSSSRFMRSSSSSSGSSSDDGECDNDLYQSETPNSSNVTVGTELSSNSTTVGSKRNEDPKTLQSRFRGHRRKISESLNQMSSMLARRSLSPLHKHEDHKPLHGNAEAAPEPSVKSEASLAGSNGSSHPKQPYEPVQIQHSLQSLSAEPEVNQYLEKSTDSDVDSLLCDTFSSTLVGGKKEK